MGLATCWSCPATPQNFYKCARDGKPLDSSLRGPKGKKPLGCKKAKNLDWQSRYLLNQIADDEIAHVKVRRSTGSWTVARGPLCNCEQAPTPAALGSWQSRHRRDLII